MSDNKIVMKDVFPTTAAALYEAWLDSELHEAMTGGGPAEIEPRVGGTHSAWSGYSTGKTLELVPDQRIVQSWRSRDFMADAPDSTVTIELKPIIGGVELTLVQDDVPADSVDGYRHGWIEFYFNPMKRYFGKETSKAKKAAVKAKPQAAKAVAAKAKPAAKKAAAKPAKKVVAKAKAKPKMAAKKKAIVKAAAQKKPAKKTAAKKKTLAAKPIAKKAAAKKKPEKKATPAKRKR